jgi:hypothetical protein
MSVDLPAPFSPTSPWTSPARRVRSSPSSTVLPKKLLVIAVATRAFSEEVFGATAALWHASPAFVE